MSRVSVLLAAVVAGAACTQPAAAQPIVIDAEEGFLHVRCIDMFGSASCEFLTAGRDGMLNCVAFDRSDRPLAVSPAFTSSGNVLFGELDASRIDRVICRPM